jgi:hypothetical protein
VGISRVTALPEFVCYSPGRRPKESHLPNDVAALKGSASSSPPIAGPRVEGELMDLAKGKDVMTSRYFFTLFLGIVLALTLVPAAQAANLLIDDSVEEEITLTHDANWEFGVLSNGTLFPGSGVPGPNAGTPGSTTAPGEVALFGGSWFVNTAGDPDPGAGVIYFVDKATKKNSCKRRGDRRRHRSVCVSDIVTAQWDTDPDPDPVFEEANISFTVVSSGCGRNLGPLPRHFKGLGVPDPASPLEISGLFRRLVSPPELVAIPSNLTVQFVGDADASCKSDKDDDDDDDKDDDDKDK